MYNKSVFLCVVLLLLVFKGSYAQTFPPTVAADYLSGTRETGNTIYFWATGNDHDDSVGTCPQQYEWDFHYQGGFQMDVATGAVGSASWTYNKSGKYIVAVRYQDDNCEWSAPYLFPIVIYANLKNRQMTLRFNGKHDYQVPDLISLKLETAYESRRDSIVQAIIDGVTGAGASNITATVPERFTSVWFKQSTSAQGKGQADMYLHDITTTFSKWGCNFSTVFDLKISADMELARDSVGYYIRLYKVRGEPIDLFVEGDRQIWYQFWNFFKCEVLELGIEFMNSLGFLDSFTPKVEEQKLSLFTFVELASGNPGVTPELLDEVFNSFPLSLTFASSNLEDDLLLNVDFMKGTSPTDESFVGQNPPAVTNPSLDHIGFAMPPYGFQEAFSRIIYNWSYKPCFSDPECQGMILDKASELATQTLKLEAPWREIAGDLTYQSGLNPDNLQGTTLETEVNLLLAKTTWQNFDQAIDGALQRKFDVILHLLQGHSTKMPKMQGKILIPDSRPPGIDGDYYYVEPNTFLWHLKVFAHAVVRRYRNKIAIWEAENELNAAKFAHLGWGWRQGDVWADDSPGGFEDRVWAILRDAIRTEDPTARLLVGLHQLNLVKGIERFGRDGDIIGINLYPNRYFAIPLLGMAVGEVVWATRRALMGFQAISPQYNWTSKEVYVNETSYPGMLPDPSVEAPSNISLDSNLTYYSQGRQKYYMQQAMQTATENGAKGFLWWGILDFEEYNPQDRYDRYGGFINRNTNFEFKQVPVQGFNSEVALRHPGKVDVVFANQSISSGGNIGGKLSLAAERDSLPSGSVVATIRDRDHVSRTDQQLLQGQKHQLWNSAVEEFRLEQTFHPTIGQDTVKRYARFGSTFPVTITSGDLSGIRFEFRDPWYLELATGEQPNEFNDISDENLEIFLNQGNNVTQLVPPYYSLRAPLYVVDELGYKWRFSRWETSNAEVSSLTSNEIAVIFRAAGARVEATYTQLVKIKVKSNILARTVTVDDTTFTGEREFEWEAGSQHTISVPGPQYDGTNTRYLFSSWSDGGAQTHAITAPDPRSPSAAMHVSSAPLGTKGLSVAGKIQVVVAAESVLTYVATLAPQHALAVGVSPSYSGTTNISDTLWSVQGDTITVTATPEYGYSFASWSGDTTGSTSTIRIAMDRPRTVTANFVWTLPPFTPELASPADSAMDLPVPAPLTWHWAKGATFYRVEISKTFDFSTIENYSETSDTSSILYLFYGTKYYWRANARNNYGTSNWSTQRSFFTRSAPPPATRPAPSNAATNVLTTASFAWDSTTGARTYQLQLSLVPNFTTLESNETEIPRNQCTIVGMLPNIQYYWRVRGINGADTSAWSSTWYFMTGSDVTWSTTWSGYSIVLKDYAVNAGVSLSISPGAFVKFAPGASLLINGTLTADGVSSQRITFDGSGYVPSDSLTEAWKLAIIRFLDEGKGSIQYADLQNANNQIFINRPTYIGGTSLVISNNTFKNFAYREPSNYAIRLWQNYQPLLIRSNTFEGAMGALKGNAIIAEFTGPYTVDWNTIRNCRIGVRLYSSWVGLCYNTIENTAYYGVQADMVSSGVSKFDDNHINYNGYGVFLNGASPYMSRNRISFNQNQGIYAGTQSSPQIGRNGLSPGQNVLRGNGIAGVMADNSSNPFMGGYSDPYVLGGYNSVYETVGGSAVSANAGSFVTAQWNYWASSTFSVDSTCSIDTSHTLASDPNNGAYLSIRPPENFIRRLSPSFKKLEFETIQSDEGAFKLALSLGAAKRFSEAKKILKDLTERSAGSKLGGFSLLSYREMVFAEILSDSTNQKRNGLKNELKSLLLSFKAREDRHPLRPLAMRMLARESVLDHDFTEAQNLNNEVISKYPESQWEKTALYDELMYSLSAQHNTPKAKEILSQMKRKYPNDELTKSARILLGDDVGLKSGYKRTEEASRLSQTKTEEGIPQQFALGQNHPNPFNPSTSFEFQLPSSEFVSIRVFDILGREVAMLVNGERAPGIYKFTWDASALPSGVYLYRMQAGRFVETRKMALAR